jgi:hypothetical protein
LPRSAFSGATHLALFFRRCSFGAVSITTLRA